MADHRARIVSAIASREGALAAWRHSPNSDTARALRNAHRAMDAALDALYAVMSPAEREAVEQRDVRRLARV